MITAFIIFMLFYFCFGIIGFALKLSWGLFKGIFGIALAIGALVMIFAVSAPVLLVIGAIVLIVICFAGADERHHG